MSNSQRMRRPPEDVCSDYMKRHNDRRCAAIQIAYYRDRCEASISFCDPTGQNAQECGRNARWRPDLEQTLCDTCYEEAR